MSKREWEAIEDSNCDMHVLRIGGAAAYANGPCRCGCGEGPRWDAGEDEGDADSLDQAKELAEGKLREMRDALVEHFAPVLRWELNKRGGGFASLGPWRLVVGDDGWWQVRVSQKSGDVVESVGFARGKTDDTPSARRAAEAALRALGVVFRTEGE